MEKIEITDKRLNEILENGHGSHSELNMLARELTTAREKIEMLEAEKAGYTIRWNEHHETFEKLKEKIAELEKLNAEKYMEILELRRQIMEQLAEKQKEIERLKANPASMQDNQ